MKRKLFVTGIAAIGLGLMACAARADSFEGEVYLTNSSPYSYGDGGEFNATLYYATNAPVVVATQATPPNIGSYSPGAPSDPGLSGASTAFQTFCIEEGTPNDVDFNPGQYYAGTINSSTQNYYGTTLTLSSTTQALYYLFSNDLFTNGTALGDYDYSNVASRSDDAGDLQEAIWYSQGDNSGPLDANSTAYINEAEAFASDSANAGALSSIQILGLFYSLSDLQSNDLNPGSLAQAQLVEVGSSVPLPPVADTSMALLGVVAGFGIFRRSRKLA